eukprot:6784225-Lingulodinium_polyedra.AAC.1
MSLGVEVLLGRVAGAEQAPEFPPRVAVLHELARRQVSPLAERQQLGGNVAPVESEQLLRGRRRVRGAPFLERRNRSGGSPGG